MSTPQHKDGPAPVEEAEQVEYKGQRSAPSWFIVWRRLVYLFKKLLKL
mgnify:CR=1 FL=1